MKSYDDKAMEKGVGFLKNVSETKVGGISVSRWCEELARIEGFMGCMALFTACMLQLIKNSDNCVPLTVWYWSPYFLLYLLATGASSFLHSLLLFFGTKKESTTLLSLSATLYALSFVRHLRQIIRFGILGELHVFMLIGCIGAPISLFMVVIIMCRYDDIKDRSKDSDEEELTAVCCFH